MIIGVGAVVKGTFRVINDADLINLIPIHASWARSQEPSAIGTLEEAFARGCWFVVEIVAETSCGLPFASLMVHMEEFVFGAVSSPDIAPSVTIIVDSRVIVVSCESAEFVLRVKTGAVIRGFGTWSWRNVLAGSEVLFWPDAIALAVGMSSKRTIHLDSLTVGTYVVSLAIASISFKVREATVI